MVLNVAVTLLNKGVFGSFQFPATLSGVHMLVSGLLSWLFVLCQRPKKRLLDSVQETRTPLSRVALLSLVFSSNIVMGNLGIRFASVSVG